MASTLMLLANPGQLFPACMLTGCSFIFSAQILERFSFSCLTPTTKIKKVKVTFVLLSPQCRTRSPGWTLIQRLCLQCAVCKEDFLPLTYSGSSSITAPIRQWSPGTSTLKRSRTSTITCTAPAASCASLQVVRRPWAVSATTPPWTGLSRSPTTSTQVRSTSSSQPREGKLQQREGERSNNDESDTNWQSKSRLVDIRHL